MIKEIQNNDKAEISKKPIINKEDWLLYGVTDSRIMKNYLADIEEALKAGVKIIQIREKELSRNEFLEKAIRVKELCHSYNAIVLVNDRVDIAKEIDADGVHLGQGDMPIEEARSILGDNKIIGISAKTVEQAINAEKSGADYIGTGAAFATSTKDDAKVISKETMKEVCNSVNIPVVAIGGINCYNIEKLSNRNLDGIAVVSALFGVENIRENAIEMKSKTKSIVK